MMLTSCRSRLRCPGCGEPLHWHYQQQGLRVAAVLGGGLLVGVALGVGVNRLLR